jgi:hypothetical protein
VCTPVNTKATLFCAFLNSTGSDLCSGRRVE